MTPTLKAKLREELGSLTSDAKLERVYRAVLEGIREPTPEMIEAAAYAPMHDWNRRVVAPKAVSYYTAMIDALLSQGEAVE